MSIVTISVTGDRKLVSELEDGVRKLPGALRKRIEQSAQVVQRNVLLQLSKGPPAVGSTRRKQSVNPTKHLRTVSGRLRQSVGVVLKIGRRAVEARIGPQRVRYAGIHERGGRAGRNHAVLIKPRPYMGPAAKESRKQVARLMGSAVDVIVRDRS
jgi:phage gpG-like protein